MKTDPYVESFPRSMRYKAQKLLRLSRVAKITSDIYRILPILGYNKTDYTVKWIMGKLTCTCQRGRKARQCSHMLAVHLFTGGTQEKQLQFC